MPTPYKTDFYGNPSSAHAAPWKHGELRAEPDLCGHREALTPTALLGRAPAMVTATPKDPPTRPPRAPAQHSPLKCWRQTQVYPPSLRVQIPPFRQGLE